MKKLLFAAVAVGMMSTSAMALEGSVNKIITKSDGTIKIVIETTGRILDGTAEANKAMLAVALTARSATYTVEAFSDGTKWTNISILPAP